MRTRQTRRDPAGRGDTPTGRQAARQPEHDVNKTAPESLHQGQGPDFQTQDKTLRKKNKAVQDLSDLASGKTERQEEAAKHETKGSDLEKS